MEVYLDNAATTRIDARVLHKMNDIQNNIYANASSSHKQGRIAYYEIEKAREICAAFINAKPEQIFFTSGGTESDNWALKGAFEARRESSLLLTSAVEHHAVLNCAEYLKTQECSVNYIPVDSNGELNTEVYREYLKDKPFLVSIMTANNEIGNIYDIKQLCAHAHEAGSLFHIDAVSAFGKIIIDVTQTDVDMMSVSAHKFHGPKGIGFLYVRQPQMLSAIMHGGSQENGMRGGTYNTPAIAGMGEAVRLLTETEPSQKTSDLKKLLREGLSEHTENVYVNGSSNTLCNILNVTFSGVDSQELLFRLNREGIYASAAAACGGNEPSHVLTASGKYKHFDACGMPYATIRFSLSKYTTQEEIEYVIQRVTTIIESIRNKKRFVI